MIQHRLALDFVIDSPKHSGVITTKIYKYSVYDVASSGVTTAACLTHAKKLACTARFLRTAHTDMSANFPGFPSPA
jgi:hypothetical protein